jgi:hypothetical protein
LGKLLTRAGPFRVLRAQSNLPVPELNEHLWVELMGEEALTVYLARPEDAFRVALRPIPNSTLWRVDPLSENVIEFSRPFHSGQELRPGRLFYESGSYVGQEWRPKDEGFLHWARGVFSICRRGLTRDPESGTYWGPVAARLRDSSKLRVLSN